MNYWVMALYFQWVTPELVKEAVELGDCSMEDLNAGYEQRMLTLEQLQEIKQASRVKIE
ncbi:MULTISPECIES: XkdX family protein [Bacillus]|uniref:XkdX family protein n=1 Tax=Bacillus sp. BS1807G30 TaxID=3153756 RepID=A0AAU7FGM5_9BACI|nr:XkdX family protein [Bacillus altitudinis]WOI40449.1 XkdX family protein [Bacillus altitudinis]